MTENLPDYDAIEVPDNKPKDEYSTHERRAAVWREITEAGSPSRVNKAELARKYEVNRSTIYRDFDRLREWTNDNLGDDAKLTTQAVFEKAIDDLLTAEDWKATKAAFDIVMEWNGWLADVGEQHREPDKSELDVEMESQTREVSYTVVRDAEDIDGGLLTDAADPADGTDYEDLGFTKAPTSIAVTDPHEEDG